MRAPLLLALVSMALFFGTSFPYSEYNGALYCNTTCDDCEDALNNDTYTLVYLNSSLSSPGASCINNPSGISGKTFDCQGNLIAGDNTTNTWGINIVSKENISIQNCRTTNYTASFRVINSDRINLTNNTEYYCGYDSYELHTSRYLVVTNNTIWFSHQNGIEFNECNHSVIAGNLLNHSGIYIEEKDFYTESGSYNVTVSNNTVYNGGWAYGISSSEQIYFYNNIAYGSGTYDFYFGAREPDDCNNIIVNLTGSDGLPVNYTNETVYWHDFESGTVILCDSDDSIIANASIHGPSGQQLGGLDTWYSDNLRFLDSELYDSYDGVFTNHNVNMSVRGNTIRDSYYGIATFGCNDTVIEQNTVYGNNDSGILLYGNNESARYNTVYGNNVMGIELVLFYSLNPYYSMPSYWHSAIGNTVYGNRLGGILVWAGAHNATVANNTVYSNSEAGFSGPDPYDYLYNDHYFGISIDTSENSTLSGNTVYSNGYYGIVINESDNAASTGDRVYDNGLVDILTGVTSAMDVSFSGLLLHSSSYPNVTITDTLEANTIYTIKQVASPTSVYPSTLAAVQNRMINITNLTGSPTIDSLIFSWGVPEQDYYDESTFDLWKYITSWTDLNATLDTNANTLNYSSLPTRGVYGILGVYTYEEDEGTEAGCTSDSDCGTCETCSGGECSLPSGACTSASQCGAGYTCEDCSCIPPECTDDGDCTGEGETCINYECTPPECVDDNDCPTGYACENYECVAPDCISDGDCASMGEGYTCVDYSCTPPECTANEDCAACFVCTDYTCILPSGSCTSSAQCPTDYTCLSCECIPPAYECTYDEDCPGEGYICSNHVCYAPECTTDNDCGECYECSDYSCELPAGSCGVNSDCLSEGAGYSCDSCSCVAPECVNDGECTGEGEVCENYRCVPPSCVEDNDCPGGYTCDNYECNAPECFYNDDCDENQVCKDYACMDRKEERPDSGSPKPIEEVEEPEEVEVEGEDEGGESEGTGSPPFVSEAVDSIAGIFFTTTDAPTPGAGEGGQVQVQETQLSIIGWIFVLALGAILLYFLLGRRLPKLVGKG